MTEAGWNYSTQPDVMMSTLPEVWADHHLRLFACACCRTVWHRLHHGLMRHAVEVAEQYAIDPTFSSQLRAASDELLALPYSIARGAAETASAVRRGAHTRLRDRMYSVSTFVIALQRTTESSIGHGLWVGQEDREKEIRRTHADLLRDIIPNPFNPPTMSSDFRTSSALALARTMYDARDFAALPILADALEEAGCGDPHVLAHCRDPNLTHVRGCWVVDLVLGKS